MSTEDAYHAAKWSIEGFAETVAMEVAPFGIGVTIVETGATPTGFSRAVARPLRVMPEYERTPAAEMRRAIDSEAFTFPNDPAKIAAAIIALVDSGGTALRLPLGSDAYEDIRASLTARTGELDSRREIAYSVVRSPNSSE